MKRILLAVAFVVLASVACGSEQSLTPEQSIDATAQAQAWATRMANSDATLTSLRAENVERVSTATAQAEATQVAFQLQVIQAEAQVASANATAQSLQAAAVNTQQAAARAERETAIAATQSWQATQDARAWQQTQVAVQMQVDAATSTAAAQIAAATATQWAGETATAALYAGQTATATAYAPTATRIAQVQAMQDNLLVVQVYGPWVGLLVLAALGAVFAWAYAHRRLRKMDADILNTNVRWGPDGEMVVMERGRDGVTILMPMRTPGYAVRPTPSGFVVDAGQAAAQERVISREQMVKMLRGLAFDAAQQVVAQSAALLQPPAQDTDTNTIRRLPSGDPVVAEILADVEMQAEIER